MSLPLVVGANLLLELCVELLQPVLHRLKLLFVGRVLFSQSHCLVGELCILLFHLGVSVRQRADLSLQLQQLLSKLANLQPQLRLLRGLCDFSVQVQYLSFLLFELLFELFNLRLLLRVSAGYGLFLIEQTIVLLGQCLVLYLQPLILILDSPYVGLQLFLHRA